MSPPADGYSARRGDASNGDPRASTSSLRTKSALRRPFVADSQGSCGTAQGSTPGNDGLLRRPPTRGQDNIGPKDHNRRYGLPTKVSGQTPPIRTQTPYTDPFRQTPPLGTRPRPHSLVAAWTVQRPSLGARGWQSGGKARCTSPTFGAVPANVRRNIDAFQLGQLAISLNARAPTTLPYAVWNPHTRADVCGSDC